MRNNRRISAEWVSVIVAILALAVAVVSLLFTFFPQLNLLNDNHIEKANAGDVKSQMFLANLNYEVGNTSESVYWYSVAITHSGNHQGKALNNLAYIYLLNDEFYITRNENYRDAMKLLRSAAELGEVDAAKNLYILLASNPQELFGEDYSSMMAFAKETLEDNGIVWEELPQTEWEYVETVSDDSVPANTDELMYVEIGDAEYIYADKGFAWLHTYAVYKRTSEMNSPEYTYIKVNK